ncbi:MAG: Bug family tripartite tricarboxylate transporter substrate binding protein [Candidatus Methylomirabilales bacterium]
MTGAGAIVLGCLLVLAGSVGPAAGAADFYAGKSIEVIVPFKEGGGTDVWMRVVAPYLQKHIAGNPKIVIKNIPGGESIHGVNQYVLRSKADGLNMVATSATNYFHALLGVKAVQYDFTKLKPLLVNPAGGAIYASPSLGVKSPADLPRAKEKLVYAGISATGQDLVTLVAFEVLGIELKAVLGYEGRGPARLAFERGESNIDYQTTPGYLSNVVPLVKEGKAVPLMSFGMEDEKGVINRDEAFPDLPTVGEVYEQIHKKKPSGAAWDAYKSLNAASFSIQKILWVKPEAPPESMKAVLDAVDRLQKDKEFLQKADKVLGGYPALRGDRLEATIHRIFQLPPEARKYLLDLLEKKYKVVVN